MIPDGTQEGGQGRETEESTCVKITAARIGEMTMEAQEEMTRGEDMIESTVVTSEETLGTTESQMSVLGVIRKVTLRESVPSRGLIEEEGI